MSFITNQLHQRKNMQIYSIFNAILLGSKSNHPEASCDMRYKNDLKGRVYHNLSFKYWIDSSISPFSPRNNYCWPFIFVYNVDQLLHATTQACGFGMQRWENLGLSLTSFFFQVSYTTADVLETPPSNSGSLKLKALSLQTLPSNLNQCHLPLTVSQPTMK